MGKRLREKIKLKFINVKKWLNIKFLDNLGPFLLKRRRQIKFLDPIKNTRGVCIDYQNWSMGKDHQVGH